jgi:hypothetical protein
MAFAPLIRSISSLMMGAENNPQFRTQVAKAAKGMLVLFQHLLDYVALRCYQASTTQQLGEKFLLIRNR